MTDRTGWYEGIDNDVYHKMKHAVGSTTLNETLRSPAHARFIELNRNDEVTKRERFGSIVHAALLEPHVFQRYKIIPECDRRTKEGKLTYSTFMNSIMDGDKVISMDDHLKALSIQNAMLAHQTFKKLIAGGFYESTGIFDAGNGAVLKIRPDKRDPESRTLFDLKTTDDARLQNFDRQILQFGYHLQAAYYLDVANMISGRGSYENFIWVVIESAPPHGVCFYEVTQAWIDLGRDKYKTALEMHFKARDSGVYESYPTQIMQAVPPAYAQFY